MWRNIQQVLKLCGGMSRLELILLSEKSKAKQTAGRVGGFLVRLSLDETVERLWLFSDPRSSVHFLDLRSFFIYYTGTVQDFGHGI